MAPVSVVGMFSLPDVDLVKMAHVYPCLSLACLAYLVWIWC